MFPKFELVPQNPIKSPFFPWPNQLPMQATTAGHPND